jgi:hypothetical protein
MYFIHIATYTDAEDFTSWLKGKNRIALNDSTEFKTWLEGQKVFPLEIYLNGTTIRFRTNDEINFFLLGFDTAMDMRIA